MNLWNVSGLIRKVPEDDGRRLVGGCESVVRLPCASNRDPRNSVRLAAFRLIEAGLEFKPGIQSV